MIGFAQDVRYTLRGLAKRPGFAAVVVLTLALGIGANAAIFSVVDAVLLRPLGYERPERLALVYSQFPSLGFDKFWISGPEFLELRRWAQSFEEVGAYVLSTENLSGGDEPQRASVAYVSASLLRTLGVEPQRGRWFNDDEDRPDAPPVALLSDGLWRRAFAADPEMVGRTVVIDGQTTTVVGIMPPGFDVADGGVEAWLPLGIDESDAGGRGSHYLYLVGRLRDDVGPEQAREELALLLGRWEEEFPEAHHPNPDGHPLRLEPLKEDLVGAVRPAVLLLLGAVGLVLLIACANVANLLLARAESRQREIAVRTALGAGRRRLVRQFMTEAVILALVGGGLGLLLGVVGVDALLAAHPDSLPRAGGVQLDARVVGFTLAVALATGLLFGLAPAFHVRGRGFFNALKEGGRTTSGRARQRFRRLLVGAEVALATVLVLGAGLLLKSFWTLLEVDPGFEPRGVLTFQIELPAASYPEPRRVAAVYDELVERLGRVPGVSSAAAMTGLPPQRRVNANDTDFEGVPEEEGGPPHNVDYYQFVTPGYFETLEIPLVAGRFFAPGDAADGPPVVVVNQTLARTFWPDDNPLGKRLRRGWWDDDEPWFTVVGVVGDVKQGGMDQEVGTELYFLHRQVPAFEPAGAPRTMNLVLRTAGDPLALADDAHRVVHELDPALPVAGVASLDRVVAGSVSRPRLMTFLVGVFGLLALALAAVGTYGVLSYGVEQRRHEVGVRLALGEARSSILGLVVGQGMRPVVGGLIAGVALAVALRRVLASLLYGVAPTDPLTFAVVIAVLVAVALAACLVPGRRATRVDPLVALRYE